MPDDTDAAIAKYGGLATAPPPPDETDAAIAKYGGAVTQPSQTPLGDQPASFSGVAQTMWDQAKGAAQGAWKGIQHTVSQMPSQYMNYKTPPPRPDLAPTTTPEKIGYGAEQAAEFLAPGGWAARGEKLLEAATKVPAARVIGKAIIQGLSAGTIAAPQSENDPKKTAEAMLAAGGTSAAINTLAPAVSKLAKGAGRGLYMSAMKPSTSLDQAARSKLFQTAQLEGIPVSEGGLTTASSKIDELQKQVTDAINQAHAAGTPGIPTADIANRLGDVRNKFSNQLTKGNDIQKINEVEQDLVGSNPPVMTLPEVQAKKVGTYGILRQKGAYGEQSAAGDESLKAIARGAKEELVSRVPELAALNPKEGALIQLEGALQKAVARIQNVNKVPLRSLIGAGIGVAGGGAHGGGIEAAGAGAGMAMLAYVIDDPWVKSRLAIAIGRGADTMAANPAAVARVAAPVAAAATSARTMPPPSRQQQPVMPPPGQ